MKPRPANIAMAAIVLALHCGHGVASTPAVEQRLVALTAELRCAVCQNQSLAESDAPLARDLRREMRAMMEAGRSDGEVIDFLVNRYGDFVRYRPPLRAETLLLWFGPFLLLLASVVVLARRLRKGKARAALTPQDAARAAALLAGEPSP